MKRATKTPGTDYGRYWIAESKSKSFIYHPWRDLNTKKGITARREWLKDAQRCSNEDSVKLLRIVAFAVQPALACTRVIHVEVFNIGCFVAAAGIVHPHYRTRSISASIDSTTMYNLSVPIYWGICLHNIESNDEPAQRRGEEQSN